MEDTAGLAYTRKLTITAQHLMNGGDYTGAGYFLALAHTSTMDLHLGEPTDAAYYRPRITHRHAQLVTHQESVSEAERFFKEADELFDDSNVIGRAINLRDFGWALCQENQMRRGLEMIEQALDLLETTPKQSERYEQELLVTRGFMARTYAYTHTDARDLFVHIHDEIHDGPKLIYTLDNLRQLAPLTSGVDHLRVIGGIAHMKMKIVTMNEADHMRVDLEQGRMVDVTVGPCIRTAKRVLSPLSGNDVV